MTARTSFPTVPIAQVPAEDSSLDQTKHRPVVLVVDDEQVIADTLSTILSLNGYAPMTAYDGATALDLASLVPPQMLISDVVTPGMTGIDLAIKVRQDTPDCEVLLFSGQAQTIDLLEPARLAGHVFALLSKPVPPAILLQRIADCLASHGASEGRSVGAPAHHRRTLRSSHATDFEAQARSC